VTRAVIGTGSSLASLAFVAREALALAIVAVAKTTARALSVPVASNVTVRLTAVSNTAVARRVEVTNLDSLVISITTKEAQSVIKTLSVGGLHVGRVDEGNLVGADSLGAVTGVLRETEAPVVVALADAVLSAGTVARASIVTASLGVC